MPKRVSVADLASPLAPNSNAKALSSFLMSTPVQANEC